ncbi:polyketide cyclase/dehydrase/lipid transport protein [Kineococcus xinjiangensis]|uniref:Polyketide cyclase/dehydrase/lipid transport protein n=1 Tax=Kineococcus xinjiangensis TaxID=512762 RepID=A0A2S6IT54_9ACTN|nr:SRPBCC family protein [Kineococcus xinjiangensis]PPK97433.1 polyketide cyclase/dehydrase/lipid transport protein [Kineococcus xinjiangensis]
MSTTTPAHGTAPHGAVEHLDTPTAVVRRVVVAAPPAEVFALLTDASRHAELDGSGTVQGVVEAPARLAAGSVFRMRMKGYTTTNTVVEFSPGALIAWRHRGRHVWRWQVRAVPGGSEVTETFDYTAKRAHRLVRALGVPRRAGTALELTLTRLQHRFA